MAPDTILSPSQSTAQATRRSAPSEMRLFIAQFIHVGATPTLRNASSMREQASRLFV